MKDVYLVNYSVKGIKTLDQTVSLSFYKKTISDSLDTQNYNIKGIYGMNGSGKSGIVTSVDILKNLLINPGYLHNPIIQKNLEAIINKKTEMLEMEVDYIAKFRNVLIYYRYEVRIAKGKTGKYAISYECLSSKKAASRSDSMSVIFEVRDGEWIVPQEKEADEFTELLQKKTANLLEKTTMSALFSEKILTSIEKEQKKYRNKMFLSLCVLYIFGRRLCVYLEQSDDHTDYFMQNPIRNIENNELDETSLVDAFLEMDYDTLNVIWVAGNLVPKKSIEHYAKAVEELCAFLQIFKTDLKWIEIDKKEDKDYFVCSLIMVYDSYKVHAEFESTGIKKLIKLYMYLREMVHGGIVFIDEFDSNLHDVYLCALLEYLMEYGEGQLCFTTHNVGPMDILKRHKKSIDFLSVDHKIYPWKKNGNYSPSKLYRNGMIEGSPFNVDSTDFIGVFGVDEGAE